MNSHALLPTFTTPNASALATGHGIADTGDFGNYIYSGFPVPSSGQTVTPFLESDAVLREVNDYFGGNYLGEESIFARAHAAGYSSALIGKVGPVAIFDVGSLKGKGNLVIDDTTGANGEIAIPVEWKEAFARSKVALAAPARGENGNSGRFDIPGTWIPNLAQQQYFLEVAEKVVLPHFKEAGKPFVLVFWSRDPDGTQHSQGDSFHTLNPGINGPTSLDAVLNADTALASLEQALKALDLYDATNIVVAADHGFSTISKASNTSPSSKSRYTDVRAGDLPLGFLAIDLATALKRLEPTLRLFDPDDSNREVDWTQGQHSKRGNGLIGPDANHPEAIIAANGGSDLIYIPKQVPNREAQVLARRIVESLLDQDYVSGLFVDYQRFGRIPGTLSTEDIEVGAGRAVTPNPAIIVNFTSFVIPGCANIPSLCAAEIADTPLQQGQGMHGSFSRADTWNFMAARGPDFKAGYVDELPASNADIGLTIAHLLNLNLEPRGKQRARVLAESLTATPADEPPALLVPHTVESVPDPKHGLQTTVRAQVVDGHVYLDAAGFPGRTVGLGAN